MGKHMSLKQKFKYFIVKFYDLFPAQNLNVLFRAVV